MKLVYCKHISWQNYDDFVYILNELTGQKVKLDDISKEIWLEIESGLSLEEIENKLLSKYNVERDILHSDITSFCAELVECNILEEVC